MDFYDRLVAISTVPIGVLLALAIVLFFPASIKDWMTVANDETGRAQRKTFRLKSVKMLLFGLFLL